MIPIREYFMPINPKVIFNKMESKNIVKFHPYRCQKNYRFLSTFIDLSCRKMCDFELVMILALNISGVI